VTRWEDVARAGAGDDYARRYAERFRRIAAAGGDVHGEAGFVERLLPAPARVLDAGCGTGRVAVRLAERGYDVVGVDVDASMVAMAREEAPGLDWRVADLAGLGDLDLGPRFDLVLVAGNVVPLVEPGTLEPVLAGLASQVADGGAVVLGFGTDAEHLPAGCPVTTLEAFTEAAAAAGLVERDRHGTWGGDPWVADGGYIVTALTRA
jgi:SAM-dependent methyltransferase